uniref:PAX-interacting protein 1 n=1 Tax=Meloidogyne floridensis TaxID=298350 RepID=A0A915PDH0_9BILA
MSSSDDSSVDEPVPVTKKGKANGKKAAAPAKVAPAKKPAPAKGKKAAQKDSDSDSSADDQPPPAKNSNKRKKAVSDDSEDDASSGDDEEYQPAKKKETKQPPQKKGKGPAKKSDSDEDVSEDEEVESVKAKNGKKEKGGGKAAAATNVEINAEGNEMFPIGMKRFAAINTFKGQLNVDIREYYQKDGGKWLPGKKGISLTQAQFFEFEKNASFASTSATSNEFSGVLSPLEPLDPNKFRNIMLDKPEVSSSGGVTNKMSAQHVSMESLSMDSSTSNEFREKSVSLDSATPKSFYHQTAPPTPITHSHQHQPQQCHSQPPQSPAIQQLQQRSMSLQQHPHVQQQQQSHLHQYFPAQPPMQQMQQPMHSQHPSQTLLPFSPIQQGQYGISPQMIQHPNSMMQGQPHWIHHQHLQQQQLQQLHQQPPPYQQHISSPNQQQQMYQQQHPSLVKQQIIHQHPPHQHQQQGVATFMGTVEGSGNNNVLLPNQQIVAPSRFSPHPPPPQQQQQHLAPTNQQRHASSSTISPEYLNYQQSQHQQQLKLPPPHYAPGFSSPEYTSNFNLSNCANVPAHMMYNQQIPHQQLPPQRPQQMLQHGIIQQQQTPSQALSQSLVQQHVILTPTGNPVNPEICLTGCVFLLIDDCNPQLVDSYQLSSIIRFYGGDVESSNPRGIPERVTHIVCSSLMDNEKLINNALANVGFFTIMFLKNPQEFIDRHRNRRFQRKAQRIVTLHWLNDTIGKRLVEQPSKAAHLPGYWSVLEPNPQISSKIISFHGFDKDESNAIKYMIRSIGAYCVLFNSKTDFLVINKSSLTDQIIEKSHSFNTQLVNYKWLFELYFGNINVLVPTEAQRYFPEAETLLTCVTISPYYLGKMSDLCCRLMSPWSVHIAVEDDVIKSAYLMKRAIFQDVSVFPEKLFRLTDNAPSEEQILKAIDVISVSNKEPINIFVLFYGFTNEQVDNMSKKVRFLAAKVVESPNECTHFVTSSLRKSVNLVTCIALGKHIVSPYWVETSFKCLQFVDPLPFFVKDRENERKYCFSLKVSVLRARQRKIFKNIIFHIGQGTQPSFGILRQLVEAADGRVVEEKPTRKELIEYIQQFSTRISS